jgi:3-oxo-5-alpha-steroid 4-dehydrogenase 1
MEVPGFLTLLYIMNTLPAQVGLSALPWENKAMGGLFVSFHVSQITNSNIKCQIGNPLPLPRHPRTAPHPIHVTNPRPSLAFRHRLPSD